MHFNVYDTLEVDMETYEKKLKVVGTIDKNTIISSDIWDDMYDECRIYYEKGNVKGWIFAPNLESNNEDEENTPCYGLTYEIEDEEEDNEDIIGSDDNKDDIEKPSEEKLNGVEEIPIQENNKENKMQIIYLCIGAALLMSLTAVVTIILINKKRKKEEIK